MTTTTHDLGSFGKRSKPNGGSTAADGDSWQLLYGAIGFVALGIAIPLYAVPHFQLKHATVAVAAGIVLYAAMRLSLLLARGKPRLLETAFWTYVYSFLSLPLLAQTAARQYPLATIYSYDDGIVATSEVVVVLGLVGYELGCVLSRRRSALSDHTKRVPKNRAMISVPRAAFIGYVGLAFVAIAVQRHGLASFFTSRDALTQNFLGRAPVGVKFYLDPNKAAGLSLLALSQVPTFIGTYLLLYVRHERRHDPQAASPSWWLIAPLVVGNLIINNPIANARFWYVTVAIGFLTIYLPLRERRSAARLFIFMFVFISLFSFHQLAAFRRTGAVDFTSKPIPMSLLTDPDYASPQQVMNGTSYLNEHSHTLGRQLAGTALVWFPRVAWPGKPGDTGQLVGGAAGFKVASPLWTEGQVDFGLEGTILYLAIVGGLVTKLDRRFVLSRMSTDTFAAFAPIMASLLVFVLRGSLQPAFGNVLPVVACILFCMNFRRRPIELGSGTGEPH